MNLESPLDNSWCDVLGFVPAGSVPSSSTLRIKIDASHLRWLLFQPVDLLGLFHRPISTSMVFSLDSGLSRVVHPQGFSRVWVEHWHLPSVCYLFRFYRSVPEPLRIMTHEAWLSALEAIQRKACATASFHFHGELEVETLKAALSSWVMFAPCLTEKAHPDWLLMTRNQSAYTMRSYGALFS